MTAGLRVQRGGPSDIDAAARLFQAYLRFSQRDDEFLAYTLTLPKA